MLASPGRSVTNKDPCYGRRDGDADREADNPTLIEGISGILSIPVGGPVLGALPEKNPPLGIQKRYFNVPARLARKDLETCT